MQLLLVAGPNSDLLSCTAQQQDNSKVQLSTHLKLKQKKNCLKAAWDISLDNDICEPRLVQQVWAEIHTLKMQKC